MFAYFASESIMQKNLKRQRVECTVLRQTVSYKEAMFPSTGIREFSETRILQSKMFGSEPLGLFGCKVQHNESGTPHSDFSSSVWNSTVSFGLI